MKIGIQIKGWMVFAVLFCWLAGINLVQEGMFFDGITYATIARNLSEGVGTLWRPFYTNTVGPEFYDHPPLVFWLQSIFFSFFGDSVYVEKFYCFIMATITVLLMIKLWKFSLKRNHASFGWLAPVLLILMPVVGWTFSNNLLEITLTVLCLAAVLSQVKAVNGRLVWLPISGVFIFLGILSKGPVALFPFATLFLHGLVFRSTTIGKMIWQTSLVVASTLTLSAVTLWAFPDSRSFFQIYYENQIARSLAGKREIFHDSRFFILGQLLFQLGPALFLVGISYLFPWLRRRLAVKNQWVYFFLLIGLSASLPLMLSPKQSRFYLLPSLPFFALGFAALLWPVLQGFLVCLPRRIKGASNYVIGMLLVLTVAFLAFKSGSIGRDALLIKKAEKISSHVPPNTTIGVKQNLCTDYGLIAYLMRYGHISTGCQHEELTYQLRRSKPPENVKEQWKIIDLYLYKKE